MSFLSNLFKSKLSPSDAINKSLLERNFISLWAKAFDVKDRLEFDNLYAEAYDIAIEINNIEYTPWCDFNWESTGYPRPDTSWKSIYNVFKQQKEALDKRIERQKKRQKNVSKMRSSMIQN